MKTKGIPKRFEGHILKRFLTDEEMKGLSERYHNAKKVSAWHGWKPNSKEWALFHSGGMNLKKWQKEWGLKSKETALRRLGKMHLLYSNRED